MDNTVMEITLKQYLDERFHEINLKLNNLEMLRQEEHDVVVSMARDIAYRSEDIVDIKKNAESCRSECQRRKSDFDKRVVDIVDPRIKSAVSESSSKLWIAFTTAVIIFLFSVAGYVIDKLLFPEETHHPTKVQRSIK